MTPRSRSRSRSDARGPVCPECDAALDESTLGNLDAVPAYVGEKLRVAVTCQDCATPLELRGSALEVVDATPDAR